MQLWVLGTGIVVSPTFCGLGFAAMSTNPPFTVPKWVPKIFFALSIAIVSAEGFYFWSVSVFVQIIAIVGAIGLLIYIFWPLLNRAHGKNKLPSVTEVKPDRRATIEVTRIEENDTFYLKVHNNDVEKIFKAQIELSSEDRKVWYLPNYIGFWRHSNKGEAQILRGHDDFLKIAELVSPPPKFNPVSLNIFYYDISATCVRAIPTSSYLIGGSTIKWDYKLRITINASPELREGIFRKDYILNVDGLKEGDGADTKTQTGVYPASDKLVLVAQAIAEAKQITPKGHDTIVFISDKNRLTSMNGIELLSVLLKLQNDEGILKLKSFPKWLLPHYDEQMGDPEYDMLKEIGIVTDPQENKFVVSLEKNFDEWLNNYEPE